MPGLEPALRQPSGGPGSVPWERGAVWVLDHTLDFSGTKVPDESVHEHQEHLPPGTTKYRFHSAAGATGRCVARPHRGLDQVAVHLGSVSYTPAAEASARCLLSRPTLSSQKLTWTNRFYNLCFLVHRGPTLPPCTVAHQQTNLHKRVTSR